MDAKYPDIFDPKCVVIFNKEWKSMRKGYPLRNGGFSGYPFYPLNARFANYLGVTSWFSSTLASYFFRVT